MDVAVTNDFIINNSNGTLRKEGNESRENYASIAQGAIGAATIRLWVRQKLINIPSVINGYKLEQLEERYSN